MRKQPNMFQFVCNECGSYITIQSPTAERETALQSLIARKKWSASENGYLCPGCKKDE